MTPVVGSIDTDTVYRDSRLTYDSVNPISIYNRNVMSDVFTGSYYDLATPQKGVNSRENVVAANTQRCVTPKVPDFSMPTEYRFNNQTGVYLTNTLAPDSSPEYPFGYRYNEFK
jgi:hypothetical protein